MFLNLCQVPIGMEITYHFQPSPVIHGPNPYLDPLSPLYIIVGYIYGLIRTASKPIPIDSPYPI